MNTVSYITLGQREYKEVWNLQREFFETVSTNQRSNTILFVEHPHVYTFGKESHSEHLLLNPDEVKSKGIAVFEIDRGGDITYHGLGQLVVYPILNMHHFYLDAHKYLRDLEEVVIRTLSKIGVQANRKTHHDKRKNYTGVWVGDEKICAIGVKFSRWTTMHGLALNINTNLNFYQDIIPCGIREYGVTSIQKLGKQYSLQDIQSMMIPCFEEVFQATLIEEKL